MCFMPTRWKGLWMSREMGGLPQEGFAGEVVRLRSEWRWRAFLAYAGAFVGRHFGGVYQRPRGAPSVVPGMNGCRRVVVVMNHPSWWDPLIAMLASSAWFGRVPAFGGMSAPELERYPFFRKLGIFPIRRGNSGARDWVDALHAIGRCERSVLWTTPQGRFVDVRDRGVPLMRGIAMAGEPVEGCYFLPVAVEYVVGRSRLPAVYLQAGEPLEAQAFMGMGRDAVARTLQQAMESEQDRLANWIRRGEVSEWELIRRGGAGLGSVYGWWRRLLGGRAVGSVEWEGFQRGRGEL